MTLFLTEDDVRHLLTMEDALAAVAGAFREQGLGRADNIPRRRVRGQAARLHTMAASLPQEQVVGLKAYTTTRQGTQFQVLLWDDATGRLLASMAADWLGRMRTGAVSGVATDWLAPPEVQTVGIFGTGYQAGAQLEAICAVRPIKRVWALGRDENRLQNFCRQMTEQLAVPVEPANDPRQLVENSQIIVTITTAKEPLFDGAWLQPGTHINAAGSNSIIKREIDDTTVQRSSLVVVDDRLQASIEAGDLLRPLERGRLHWYALHQLGDAAVGRIQRQSASDITLFLSQGIALADVAVAKVVYERALAEQ